MLLEPTLKLGMLFNYKAEKYKRLEWKIKASNKLKERCHVRGKRTKLRGFPLTQQPRNIPPKVVKMGLPTITRHNEISRLLIVEGRREIDDKSRPSIPRHELIIPKLFGFFQMVKVDGLI